ncbi:MAG: S41 family peptidase [Firmicutes bacterium]|nr:S41 family peptidase [Bacillota bacterium]
MKKNKTMVRALAFLIVIVMIVTTVMMSLTMVFGASPYVYGAASDVTDEATLDEELDHMADLMAQIRELYKDEVSFETLVNGAYQGIFEALGDPYSEYFETKEEGDAYIDQASGEFDGIGITMENDGYGRCRVVSPVAGTPAEKAGIKSGDIVVSVDGVPLEGKTLDDWGNMIRGEAGTHVTLVVNRNGAQLKFTVTRARIRTEAVSWTMLEDNIAYIQISQFDSDADKEFLLKRAGAIHAGAEALIIDVRNNPGGHVEVACQIANLLIPGEDKTIMKMVRQGEELGSYLTAGAGMAGMPVVLLVNEGSASASEILAGALQDNDAATLVGTTTYGKGIAQLVGDLDNGTTMKLSTYYFTTPDGHTINGVGITPDEVVINGAGLSDEQVAAEYAKLAPMTELTKYYKGQMGLNVYAAQQRLNLLGYEVPVNAVMDDVTVKAIAKFQGDTGMSPYGGLDYSTMGMLEKLVAELLTGGSEDKQLKKAIEILSK